MSAARRAGWAIAVLALASPLALAPAPAAASHGHGPSAAQVAHSKQAVASLEQQVKSAEAAVSRAKVTLAKLDVSAEVAFEAYDGARVKLQSAQRAVATARVVLNAANAQVAKGQRQVTRFATAAYENGGLSALNAYLEPGGAATLVSRVGALDAISSSEQVTLQRLAAARIYQAVVTRQAEAVEANAAKAAAAAARAKSAAQAALSRQRADLRGLHRRKAHVSSLLAQARTRAGKLQRERIEAIARARAAAARRAAAAAATAQPPAQSSAPAPSPYSGSSGSTAGTVSAATALAALHEAESQIGKPYQWGAAGPNTYDCSGLVMWAYAREGVSLEHFTGDQWNEGAHISQSQLRPGDLVFFAYNTSDPSTIHHVGMYAGNDEMVDAPFTGADVRYDPALRPDYIGAVRPYQR